MQTIVIGHRNPDMDSICSAVGYATLKQLLGDTSVIAGRAGTTNERIDFVIEKFGVEPPALFTDVSPRVADVMELEVVAARHDMPLYDAISSLEHKRLRGLPVIDGEGRCLGLLSAFAISHYIFPRREEAARTRVVAASLADIVATFGGTTITGHLSPEVRERWLVVGAMNVAAFSARIERYPISDLVLIVGDRRDIQMRAIESRVSAVIVTGGLDVEPDVREAAEKSGVPLISSPHDTATTVLLSRGAVRVENMIDREFSSFSADTMLELARTQAAPSAAFIFPVLDERGRLVGILSKSDFLKPIPRQLILVDHNELTQAVHGAEKLAIVEILDHHRIGGFSSSTPILFWNNPVGSTSSIVAMCYQQMGVPIPKPVAGLLMAGLISDTLNLTSPTATAVDREILQKLAGIAETQPAQLAEQIFSVGSPLLTMAPDQVVSADAKEYTEKGHRFSVSQIEELSFGRFAEKEGELLKALEAHRNAARLLFSALLVTDINTQNSLLLVCGDRRFTDQIDFFEINTNIWALDGVVSRKKQLLPYLLRCLDRLEA